MKLLKGIYPALKIKENVSIVGSSSNMIGKKYASLIDSADEVIRFNRAPTKGWEKHVGKKCTLRIVNHHTFANARPDYKRLTKKGNPQNFVRNLRNQRIIVGNSNAQGRWERRDQYTHPSCESFYIQVPPRRRLKKKYHLPKPPSIGLIGIYLIISNGIVPNVFGFGVGEGNMTHYWEKRSPKTPCHNFSPERETLKLWHKKGWIKLYL